MSFASLGLSEPIVRAVTQLGYEHPTPIQQQAIPAILAGGDLLAGAQTGTGKTAGFVLPMLEILSRRPPSGGSPSRIRALILTPTRELAAQVEESVRDYGRFLRLTSMTMFGGVNINPQIARLRQPLDILVATPGRLLDHVGQRTVDLSSVELLVLDEADRMLDMGFVRDIRKILALLPARRQNLLFSATFSDEIRTLAADLLDHPASIEVAKRNAPAESVAQRVVLVDKHSKRALLARLILDGDWHQVLVFTRTKHAANRLAEQLNREGISAMPIHGNKSQAARTRALSQFKSGELRALVATDIAARGLDIEELPHVVNFELPNVPEDYVHRIGRTGRAGSSGEAVSLVCVDEYPFLADIERLIKRKLSRDQVAGFEPDLNVAPQRIPVGGDRGRRYDDGLGEALEPRGQPGRHAPRQPARGGAPAGRNQRNHAPTGPQGRHRTPQPTSHALAPSGGRSTPTSNARPTPSAPPKAAQTSAQGSTQSSGQAKTSSGTTAAPDQRRSGGFRGTFRQGSRGR